MKSFEDVVLSPHFAYQNTFQYSETFVDDEDFSNMKSKKWLKIKDVNASKEFSKKETNIEESNHNIITYTETKQFLGDSAMPSGSSITILVQRKHYKHNISTFPLELTVDEAEFPNGERYTVFALFIDLPATSWDQFQDTLASLNEKTLTVPVRSKIIQFLYTTHRDVYQILEKDKLVLEPRHYKSEHIQLFDKYHRRSILFRKWKAELRALEEDKLSRLTINLGISTKRLLKLLKNKLVDDRIREIISNYSYYSPLTKKTLQEKDLNPEDQKKYIDFMRMGIEKNLRNSIRELGLDFSLPTLYRFPLVEFFAPSEEFTKLEERFQEEIKSGFVRLSHKKRKMSPLILSSTTFMANTSATHQNTDTDCASQNSQHEVLKYIKQKKKFDTILHTNGNYGTAGLVVKYEDKVYSLTCYHNCLHFETMKQPSWSS